jgi:hypothetical protein
VVKPVVEVCEWRSSSSPGRTLPMRGSRSVVQSMRPPDLDHYDLTTTRGSPQIDSSQTSNLVVNALGTVIANRQVEAIVIHSDTGT